MPRDGPAGFPGVPYDPGEDELLVSYGVLEIMISTAIMFGGVLALLKRYRPPPGSFILMFGSRGSPACRLWTHSTGPGRYCKWSWSARRSMWLPRASIRIRRSPTDFGLFGLVAPDRRLVDPIHRLRGLPPESRLAP